MAKVLPASAVASGPYVTIMGNPKAGCVDQFGASTTSEQALKQVRQFLRDGALAVEEVPTPHVGPGDVLVRSHYSFVSVGTERMKVSQARMSLLQKARERPDQVKQVLETLRQQGVMPTLRKVTERLRAPTTLGYSCAGTVAAVGSAIEEFRIGDRVACIGEGLATHAEYNAVPRNLVVKVPLNVSLEAASASAVGAIALQGIRQAELQLGESVAIIGLGLLGQFLVQLCRANGCQVVGIDIDPAKCALAVVNGAVAASDADTDQALHATLRASGGLGVDAVLLTASTKDIGPIELAAAVVRDRGRVICLGNTAIELDWRTWFGKEIDFRFSRAMGAGMYDSDYLMHGKDYPIGYVRWTAHRNMQAFLQLIADGKLDVTRLITHRYSFDEAMTVFDRIATGELAQAVGIVFEYSEPEVGAFDDKPPARTFAAGGPGADGKVRLAQIGAGNYAKSMLMPYFASLDGLSLEGICTSKGLNAESLARRYGFHKATVDAEVLIQDPQVSAVMIATRHDSHARYALAALQAGKHAYVEKPLAITDEQLAPIAELLASRGPAGPTLWVGHNRRFSPLSIAARAHFQGVPARQVVCTVRSAAVPGDSWYHDPAEGGGILFGDVCHFIDLAIYFSDSIPIEVSAFSTPDPSHLHESWSIQLRFASGGVGLVHYVCGSERGWERETIDILGGGRSARIAGFRRLALHGSSADRVKRKFQPDMGQQSMLAAMVAQFSRAPGTNDLTDDFLLSAQTLLAVRRSIVERRIVSIEPRFPYSQS